MTADSRRKWDSEGMLLLTTLNERVHNLKIIVEKSFSINAKKMEDMQMVQSKRDCATHELRIKTLETITKVVGVTLAGLIGRLIYSLIT